MEDLKPALEAALQEARLRLTKAEAQRQALLEKIGNLQEEVRGLELALARRKGSTANASGANGWSKLTRTGAVERIMRETGKPMAPAEIARALMERGRSNDKPHYVSAALAYLKTRGKAISLGEGLWKLPDAEPDSASKPLAFGLHEMDQIVTADAEKRAASG